jgi:uncharacterized membrane protein
MTAPIAEFKGQAVVVIQAPPAAVYAYLADLTRHPEWASNLTKVKQVTPGPAAVGTTFRTEEGPPPVALGTRLRMMVQFVAGLVSGAQPYSEATLTALEPDRRIAWHAAIPKRGKPFSYAEWEFCLEPAGTGTRVTQRFRYAPPDLGGARMIGAAGVTGIEQACAVNLQNLKRRLEAPSAERN